LLLSLQAMSRSLGAMIQDVSTSGDAIALASRNANGNQDLSQRTEITPAICSRPPVPCCS
jgi:methyl-accepting chemotaxis protein